MRINNNMSAVITNNQLLGNEESLSDVMEKLSSGLSINHASDNPSGIAIAGKMQAQIEGLGQASTNGEDGISVLQTAEGALKEVTDMIQRMRELSVQAANGTNSKSEKEAIQLEIDSLLAEVDRISDTTQFNSISLLNGALDDRTYANNCSRIQTSNTVAPGTYQIVVNEAATFAYITSTPYTIGTMTEDVKETYSNTDIMERVVTNATFPATGTENFLERITHTEYEIKTTVYSYNPDTSYDRVEKGTGLPVSGTVLINGSEVELFQGMGGIEVYEAIRNAAEKGNVKISDQKGILDFKSTKYGTDAEVTLMFSSTQLAQALGFDPTTGVVDDGGNTKLSQSGKNPEIEIIHKGDRDGAGELIDSEFGSQATASFKDGNRVTITNTNGFEMSFLLDAGFQREVDPGTGTIHNDGIIKFNVTDIGSLTLHIGANENQEMDVRIRSINTEAMYIEDIDVTRVNGAEDAMYALDDALEYVTSLRAQLGAYENRLEHTTRSLDETEENMTAAISRIEDADMASTMVEYTKYTVLQQAGTSALAQANELPQLALQLLQ